jgi:glutathione S-transferase
MKPKAGSDDYWKYIEWIHYAEGSAMLPLLMALYTGMLGEAAAPLKPRVDSEIANNLEYLQGGLGSKQFFVGDELTGADIQLLFVLEAAGARLDPYPNLVKYRAAMQDRPAYRRGIEKGGEYALMSR